MKSTGAVVVAVLALAVVGRVSSQTQPAAGATDLYHVSFSKAVPGEAVALGEALAIPDKTAPMPDHFVVLRHQEGDDWDYLSSSTWARRQLSMPGPALRPQRASFGSDTAIRS